MISDQVLPRHARPRFALRTIRCTAVKLAAGCPPPHRQIIERGDRVGLRPEADSARFEPSVVVVEMQRAIEPGLHVIPHGDETYGMPLAQRRRLHPGRGDLAAPAVVIVEAEVVFERVGPHQVVLPVIEAEDDAARRVFPAGHRLELHRDIDVAVGPWRDDHIELVPRRSLYENLLAARRTGHLLDRPLAGHGRPPLDPRRLEIEGPRGSVVGQPELRWRREDASPPTRADRGQGGQRGLEPLTASHHRLTSGYWSGRVRPSTLAQASP